MANNSNSAPIDVSKNTNMSIYFPETKNANKLKITNVGRYSITKPNEAEFTSQIIKDYIKSPKTKTITDGTAGLGGNVINFAKHFKKVVGVEKNKLHYEMLKNNVGVYKLKNVDVINADYTDVYQTIKQDIVYMDPPWGGPQYKKYQAVRLFMSGTHLPTIVNNLKDKAQLVALKVPYNFDFNNFIRFVKYSQITIRNIPNARYKIIIVHD